MELECWVGFYFDDRFYIIISYFSFLSCRKCLLNLDIRRSVVLMIYERRVMLSYLLEDLCLR